MIIAGIIVGGFVLLLILWTVIRYRRRRTTSPAVPVPHRLEILYTVVPIIIVLVLFVFTVLTENNVDAVAPPTRSPGSASPPSSGAGRSTTRRTASR